MRNSCYELRATWRLGYFLFQERNEFITSYATFLNEVRFSNHSSAIKPYNVTYLPRIKQNNLVSLTYGKLTLNSMNFELKNLVGT